MKCRQQLYLDRLSENVLVSPQTWIGSRTAPLPNHRCCSLSLQEVCGEVEVLMERMKQLQECRDDEEASQEEMATRFEREKTESMLVVTAEDEECVPSRDISRHFEDPSYGYKDFSRRGEHVPTFRAQVKSQSQPEHRDYE